jgi:DNA-binding MarR family transcriptional regulator
MTEPASTSTPMSDGDYRSLAAFRHALRVFLRFSEDAARAAELTPAQHQLLLAIRGWGGPSAPTISDVAEMLQLRHHSAVELVQRAAATGLVVATGDPNDGRRQRLTCTESGEAKLASLSLLHRDELRRFRREMNDLLRELDDDRPG